ncbi:hypothetical protein CLI92_09130 [Vandammella animalimorsus]|uniref:Uncharacterized protein n=2 Tax=Vandammella animalimorsus TaxID=2029117 RepID=A0A2A2T4Q6_9BURK|nr:hypothetical protein [Vandammella animalimorsus]PAX16484.1 hypothetical protein CLI92_09130 [Vandammella animalimorsus]PAX18899.1 hypothetical protein CLI93_11210 [Vandammella animalimorsus]
MGISINTQRAHMTRQLGDVVVVLTWVNDERAMVLLPAYRPGAPWFIVMDGAAWQYDDPRYLARAAAKAAEVLGMPGSAVKLAGIMHDHLDDLLTMPSAPPPEKTRATFGEMRMLADGKLVGGEEVRLDVPQGARYA